MDNNLQAKDEVIASYKIKLAAAHSKLDRITAELLETARKRQLEEARKKLMHS